MRYAVISDVHANAVALRRVLEDARQLGVEKVVCLGDVVGYGPLPSETLSLVRASCCATVAGNHDDAVSGRGDASEFIDLAGDAAARHREALSKDDVAWLRSLPYVCGIDGATCVHGDLSDPPKFYYVESEDDAAATLGATDAQIVFVGHTHVPCIFFTGDDGTVQKAVPQDFAVEAGRRYVVNPGSVGYPRESGGQCFSSYVIYDTQERSMRFRRLPFSVASVMQRGRNPRRIGAKSVVAICAAAALGALLVSAAVVKTLAERGPREAVSAEDESALVVEAKSIGVMEGHRYVTAGLELSKRPKSAPVDLRTTFLDGEGKALAAETVTVKSTRTTLSAIPASAKGAAGVEFKVLRQKKEDEPKILRFAPRSAAEKGK